MIITSNRKREIHDALKRRCFYHWADYPTVDKEREILRIKVPNAGEDLRRAVVACVQELRNMDLYKAPGIAETIDWAQALVQLDAVTVTEKLFDDTVGALLKYQDDITRLQGSEANQLLTRIQTQMLHERRS